MTQTLPYLVADVGGTNTRLALAGSEGVLPETLRRFRNRDYTGFADCARAYLNGQTATRLAVAIAGPVTETSAELTNWPWRFERDDLRQSLGLADVCLLNDLAALGHALPVLPAGAVTSLTPSSQGRGHQAIVVGLGTGFNCSLVNLSLRVVFEAEVGHSALPHNVVQTLQAAGASEAPFETVEHLFSGRGLARLHVALGGTEMEPPEVAEASDPTTARTMDVMARALSVYTRELAYMFHPASGIYFNGSLARSLLLSRWTEAVAADLRSDDAFEGRFAQIPLFLLTADEAALHGCAAYLAHRHPS